MQSSELARRPPLPRSMAGGVLTVGASQPASKLHWGCIQWSLMKSLQSFMDMFMENSQLPWWASPPGPHGVHKSCTQELLQLLHCGSALGPQLIQLLQRCVDMHAAHLRHLLVHKDSILQVRRGLSNAGASVQLPLLQQLVLQDTLVEAALLCMQVAALSLRHLLLMSSNDELPLDQARDLFELEADMTCWVRCLRALQAELGVPELQEQQQQQQQQGLLFMCATRCTSVRACVLLLAMVHLQLKTQGRPCQVDEKVCRPLQKQALLLEEELKHCANPEAAAVLQHIRHVMCSQYGMAS